MTTWSFQIWDSGTLDNYQCVYWDFNLEEGRGDWSNEGCNLAVNITTNRTICYCDHLTSFAVIMVSQTAGCILEWERRGKYLFYVVCLFVCLLGVTCLLVALWHNHSMFLKANLITFKDFKRHAFVSSSCPFQLLSIFSQDFHGQVKTSLVLTLISTIGCGISIATLTVTIITYLSIKLVNWKHN